MARSQLNPNHIDFNSDIQNNEMRMRTSNIKSQMIDVNPLMSPQTQKGMYSKGFGLYNISNKNHLTENFGRDTNNNYKMRVNHKVNNSASMQNLNNFGYLRGGDTLGRNLNAELKNSQIYLKKDIKNKNIPKMRNIKTSKSIRLDNSGYYKNNNNKISHKILNQMQKSQKIKSSSSLINKNLRSNKTKKSLIKNKSKNQKSVLRISTIEHVNNVKEKNFKEKKYSRISKSRSKSIINTRLESEKDLGKSITQTQIIHKKRNIEDDENSENSEEKKKKKNLWKILF